MEEPTYPDTPWWSNLTAVLVTLAVAVPVTWYFATRGVPTGTVTAPSSGLLKDTLTYIPHVLLLFGVLADMFTYQGVYSIPSLLGLLSIPLNFLMQYFWTGILDAMTRLRTLMTSPAAPQPAYRASRPTTIGARVGGGAPGQFFTQYDGCTLQGFGWARSPYAPQTLVITATIFSYYIFDLIMNRGWTNASAAITLFFVLFGAQSFSVGQCPGSDEGFTGWKAGLAAFAEGLLYGGTAYGIVQAYFPGSLPTTAISPFPRKRMENLKPGPNGTYVDDAGNPYNCLPNGQCYPDMSTQESRKEFAKIAAKSMGTGAPAVAEDCPAA